MTPFVQLSVTRTRSLGAGVFVQEIMRPVSTLIYMLSRHNPILNPFLPSRYRVSAAIFESREKISWEGDDINFNLDFIRNEVGLDISAVRVLRTLDVRP